MGFLTYNRKHTHQYTELAFLFTLEMLSLNLTVTYCLGFLICEMGMIPALTTWFVVTIK